MIDPERLIASATRIYGDEMERLWGKILPAHARNVATEESAAGLVQVGDVVARVAGRI